MAGLNAEGPAHFSHQYRREDVMNETSLSGGFHPQNPPEIVRGVIEQLAREAAEYDDIQPVGRWLARIFHERGRQNRINAL